MAAGLASNDSRVEVRVGAHPGAFEKGVKVTMKKVAIITAAVCALGLGACTKNNADTNTANETAVENTASSDVNAASTDATNAADAALNAAGNSVENADNAVENAQNAVENK
jgi:hypothetical protein